jgi:hypothetical protein
LVNILPSNSIIPPPHPKLNLTNSGTLNPGGYGEYYKSQDTVFDMHEFGYVAQYHNDNVTTWSIDHEHIHENNILVDFGQQVQWAHIWNLIRIGTSFW